MFPDSKVSIKMELGHGKICYVVNKGNFKQILKDKMLLPNCFIVGFNKSLNQVTQQCDMDLVIVF